MKIYRLLLFALLLSSCKSQRCTVHDAQCTDSVRQTIAQSRVDSVYVRDSIYIRERGDTVYVDRWHVRWRERAATKADTVYIERQQSEVKVPPPERYVPKFYKWCTGILFGLLAIAVVRLTFFFLR